MENTAWTTWRWRLIPKRPPSPQAFPIYKATAQKCPPNLPSKSLYIHKMIQAMGIPLLAIEGVEADDIIGTLAHRACLEGHHVIISTGDKDMCQLVNPCVIVENSFDDKRYDIAGSKKNWRRAASNHRLSHPHGRRIGWYQRCRRHRRKTAQNCLSNTTALTISCQCRPVKGKQQQTFCKAPTALQRWINAWRPLSLTLISCLTGRLCGYRLTQVLT